MLSKEPPPINAKRPVAKRSNATPVFRFDGEPDAYFLCKIAGSVAVALACTVGTIVVGVLAHGSSAAKFTMLPHALLAIVLGGMSSAVHCGRSAGWCNCCCPIEEGSRQIRSRLAIFNTVTAIGLVIPFTTLGASLLAPAALQRTSFVGAVGQGELGMATEASGVPDLWAPHGPGKSAQWYTGISIAWSIVVILSYAVLTRSAVPRYLGHGPCGLLPLLSTVPTTAAVLALPMGPLLPLLPPYA